MVIRRLVGGAGVIGRQHGRDRLRADPVDQRMRLEDAHRQLLVTVRTSPRQREHFSMGHDRLPSHAVGAGEVQIGIAPHPLGIRIVVELAQQAERPQSVRTAAGGEAAWFASFRR
jgi:hypothetical protein